MPTAYSYRRFSSPAQAQGHSLARQIEIAELYCAQNGLTLSTDTYEDLGVSGYTGANLTEGSGLSQFLNAVQAGHIPGGSYLLIEAFDRLTRMTPDHALTLLMSLMTAGITVVTLQDGKAYSSVTLASDIGSLLMSVMGLFVGHEESRRKSIRLSAVYAKKRATADNRIRLPFWIDRQADGTLFAKEKEADLVRLIFALAANEGLGSRAIATRLNSEGTLNPNGKRWSHSSIAKLLRSRSVLGEYAPHTKTEGKRRKPIGQPLANFYPAVVDEGTFVKVSKALRPTGPKGNIKGPSNLFSGLVSCSCGAVLHFKRRSSRDTKDRLFCPARCGQPSIPYEEFEIVTILGFNEALQERINTEASPVTSVDRQEAKQEELRREMRNVAAAISKLGDTPELLEQFTLLKQELESVQQSVQDSYDSEQDELGGIQTWRAVAGQEYLFLQNDPTYRRQLEAVIRRWITTGKLQNVEGGRQVCWTISSRRKVQAGASERILPVSLA